MKRKTYLLTLILFLLFFNGSILLISIISLKTSLDSTRRGCLGEHTFITAALSKDINAVESRGTAAKSAMLSLFESYAVYYGKQNVYLEIWQNNKSLYSSLPQGQKLNGSSKVKKPGERVICTLKSQDRKYICISGSLPIPYDNYVLNYYYDLTNLTKSWGRLTNILFLIGIAVSSLLALCLILLLNRIFEPLRQISKVSRNIAEGNYANRIPFAGSDELSVMAVNFNNMAEAVESHIDKLADAAEQKQRFIDNFAHELRTPLTSIYGYAEYMQKAAISEEDKVEATGYIMSESRRLQNLAHGLLQLASLRSSEIIFADINTEELLQSMVETLRGKAEEKQVTLSYECGYQLLCGDRDLLQSLLVNLADNAINACCPGGSVMVKAIVESDKKIILVQDNGKGMTAEQASHITEAFYRVDKARRRSEGGVGLGLSICEQIAGYHGAALSFASQPEQGTTAKIIFTTL